MCEGRSRRRITDGRLAEQIRQARKLNEIGVFGEQALERKVVKEVVGYDYDVPFACKKLLGRLDERPVQPARRGAIGAAATAQQYLAEGFDVRAELVSGRQLVDLEPVAGEGEKK